MANGVNNNAFNKRVYGLIIIKSKNSNFNADFTGNPRRLPDKDGTIFATDKAIKYAIRKYWVDKGKNVFVWRSRKDDGDLRTRDERMEFFKNKFKDDYLKTELEYLSWLENHTDGNIGNNQSENNNNLIAAILKKIKDENISSNKEKKKLIDEEIKKIKTLITAKIFANCIDTKLFGVTYTGEGPVSLTGPVQISYGINKYAENLIFVSDIITPYPTGEESTHQGSVGKETKSLEIYYVYDFSINPDNILTHYEDNEEIKKLFQIKQEDINNLKEALKYAVTKLDTTSKKGSENVMLLWIELPENSKKFLPEMKDLVKIEKGENGKVKISLGKIKELFEKANIVSNDNINNDYNIELYYSFPFTDIENWDISNILDLLSENSEQENTNNNQVTQE